MVIVKFTFQDEVAAVCICYYVNFLDVDGFPHQYRDAFRAGGAATPVSRSVPEFINTTFLLIVI